MSLTDVFGGSPSKDPEQKKGDILSALESKAATGVTPLEDLALSAAGTYDTYRAKRALLKAEEARLKAQMDSQLAALRDEVKAAWKDVETVSASLKEEMETSGITEVPLHDRDPIYLKTTKGAKKSITKTWLCSKAGIGKQAGEALWARVPRKDDKTEVVIPDRYDDQPSD